MRNLSNPHGTAYAGSFQMDVCTTLPCQLTLRGSPTLTEINFIVLEAYPKPNENFVLVAFIRIFLLSSFQTDGVDQLVEGAGNGGV